MRNARNIWLVLRFVMLAMFAVTFGMGSAHAAGVTLSATGSDGKIALSWTTTVDIKGLQVMRDTDADPSGRQRIATLPGSAHSYTDNTVVNGRQYWYWIKYTDVGRNTGNSNAGSATAGSGNNNNGGNNGNNNGNAGATCANAVALALPKVFTGVADTCLAVSGTIDNVNSWGAETVEINGVSYKSKWSNQMPARINGNYYIRYVAKQSWAHFEINGSGGSDNGNNNNNNGNNTSGTALPGDIAAAAGTPLVASHSMSRALYAAYAGKLFQVRRASDSRTQDISARGAGGLVDMTALDAFCAQTSCRISVLYDQSGNGNDLPQEDPASQPDVEFWNTPNGTRLPMAVSHNKQWLRNRTNTHKIPVNAEPQTLYWVIHGNFANQYCCYDYGNMQRVVDDIGPGTMNALYFGTAKDWSWGAGNGPWLMTDFEWGLFAGPRNHQLNSNSPSISYPGENLITGFTKTNGTNHWVMKVGNAASGALNTTWDGSLPTDQGYAPLSQQGGLSLGEGGDGSAWGTGAFSEGVVIASYTSDATDNAIQNSITGLYGSNGADNGNGQNNNNGNNNGGNVVNYTLDIGVSGNGSGSTSLSPGKHDYKAGSSVTITATPASGSVFSGWSGAATGTANPLTITMNGNKSLTAMFTAENNGGNTGGDLNLAGFPVGVAVNAGNENNSIVNSGTSARQQAVVFKYFDQMTAGNIMKMSYLHPSENSFTFNQADDLVALAHAHGLDIHAHTLIWHADYQVPGFMKNYGGDFAAMLKNHVQTIVTHFRGKVVSWDVVNEALADDGEGTVGNGLRSTVFSQKMGLNFIDQAFINARAADANVDLFYNDYNTETGGQKTRNLLALVDGMKSRGVPITGVGFQMHVSFDWPSISDIEASMKAIANRGLKVKISELDVSMSKAYSSFTADAAAKQKQRYHDIVAAYMRAVPAAQRAGITVWGVWDADSWINQPNKPDWPLLFDGNFQPKPALQGFADALTGK